MHDKLYYHLVIRNKTHKILIKNMKCKIVKSYLRQMRFKSLLNIPALLGAGEAYALLPSVKRICSLVDKVIVHRE